MNDHIRYNPDPGRVQPVYVQGPGYYAPTSGMAVTALVCALIGASIFGVIFGLCAMPEINDGRRTGKGLAIAGIVIGTIGSVAWFLLLLAASTATA